MPSTRFRTAVLGVGNNTGIPVPPSAIEALGAGRRPAVRVSVGGYTYDSTPGVMGGQTLIPLSKAHRTASGLAVGDDIEVTLELLPASADIDVPASLAAALARAALTDAFAGLAPSRRKEACRLVDEAKGSDTRDRRIRKIVDSLA